VTHGQGLSPRESGLPPREPGFAGTLAAGTPLRRVLEVEGGHRLAGEVRIGGSKNAALAVMAATLLTDQPCRLTNVPGLADVDTAAEIMRAVGARVARTEDGALTVHAPGDVLAAVPLERARMMRASILFMGPLLARTGRAVVPKPGGDDIGMRRLDQHVYGLVQLGAEIYLDMPTVTGTENLMMAASRARGQTRIYNAAREPHVQDLARALNAMGARITGAGSDEIAIEGVERLSGFEHRVVADYLEAGTYALAAAATGGEVRLVGAPVGDLKSLVLKMRLAGVDVEAAEDGMVVARPGGLRPTDLITWTHPGFATDLQPQYTALMLQAQGQAVVQEFLYENRFHYVGQLAALGASIEVLAHGRSIRIYGPCRLRGAAVTIPDIRAGAALLIAAMCAEGTSQVAGVDHLDRGYEAMAGKLSGLGARLRETEAVADEPHSYRASTATD
jgi:UDP-N-acetylglucosamine 1-carboxyvinyltransferase